ncbi:SIS domain-containing protein [Heyndrickxia sporothermodurans]|uniref:SIS domain-containing protein n=1 Tax=Heyndrickxia sporothermodurans TaxID=46224 RepID=A0AB37HJM6_9BACI|nr:SIS domain-containing protein [Heyndrickxia sporothermodurans]MBL7246038.1 SIS domain-containing protein [Heyndrickxia sporothermodurans]MEB6549190.1 SIS domain-containing protein [Heyndrickxia sporothermodurans]MED3656229.1 SIS domain-containing protein [Heyndrickxia sporothermodurans]MED3780139.1 SIS domain-containing protein [Heyndrickxia sporothermodurans]QQX27045.1 SIS domain-containing protein [Heyndrickxia sporothermodurans]
MRNYVQEYYQHVNKITAQVLDTQYDQILKAAKAFSESIKNGNTIYVFGASHAGIIAEELFYRTGGLAVINPILNPTLMLNTRPVTLTSQMERMNGFGKEIFNSTAAKSGDTILIHSVSGRNPVSVDMALAAKEKGLTTIGLTNITYSSQVSSRHESGKNLYEVVDIVIDNCGDFEDSSMLLEGMDQKIGPTSTIIGSFIVNSIVIETVNNLLKAGVTPPVFHSANVDGGDEFNKKVLEKNKNNIHYM